MIFKKLMGGGKTETETLTLFFASDFHGSNRTYRKFINSSKYYNPDVLLLGGDIVGKVAIPIIRETNGRYRAHLMGKTETIEGASAMEELQERLSILGFYWKIMGSDEYEEIAADPEKVESLFRKLAAERLNEWISIADERLRSTGIRCYVLGGNDDYQEVLDIFESAGSEIITLCEGKLIELNESYKMIGVGHSNPTPWDTARELPDEELEVILSKEIEKLSDPHRSIFNIHVPPKESTLDTCPALDWGTDPPTPIVKAGETVMHGAGSAAVRRAIETHQPVLSLHGHIHESGGTVKIGDTLSVNPGSEYSEGVLRGCIITMSKNGVKGYQLTTG